MVLWSFKNYITSDGENLVRAWYENQDDIVRANFDATLFILRNTRDWLERRVRNFKVLTERHAGLSELIIDIDVQVGKKRLKRHIRPAGIWRPECWDFILLIGAEKSGRNYNPLNAFDLALQYKAKFDNGIGSLCEHI